jgi:hypothetical protein
MRETELKEIIKSFDSIKIFLNENFTDCNLTKNQLLKVNHNLYAYKFNKTLNKSDDKFTLNGLPIKYIYGLVENEKEIALYIFVDIDHTQTKLLVDLFGMPWNVLKDDYEIGDYDMLLWDDPSYEISMLHDFVTGTSRNSRLLIISNISFKNLPNTSSWD